MTFYKFKIFTWNNFKNNVVRCLFSRKGNVLQNSSKFQNHSSNYKLLIIYAITNQFVLLITNFKTLD